MIPILFPKNEDDFTSNGLGRLTDCTYCEVEEERNGIYECEFQYPITGKLYSELQEGMLIGCTHDDKGDIQPFEIYMRTAPINGLVTFNAHHISYRLRQVPVRPVTATTCASALTNIFSYTMTSCPFEAWTDKTTSASFSSKIPQPLRALLGGQQGSILDVYGGEFEWDKFLVKLYANRGNDTDVTIRYGKNMLDLKETLDASNLYNAGVGYWEKDDTVVYGAVTKGTGVAADPIAITMDFSQDYDTAPTAAQLNAKVLSKLDATKPWVPKQNIKVDFVQMWQTTEYEDVAALQRCGLCDTVSVYYPALGVTAEEVKVIRVVYDVLRDRYSEMELGEARSSFADVIQEQTEELIADKPSVSMMQAAIDAATALIRGGLGGHVVINTNADGEPEEILIMDTDDVNTAVKVWRWNLGGLGYSSNGVNGPYTTAITQNGAIVADFITAGTMTGNRVRAGLIQDETNTNYWNLTTGFFNTQSGNIGPWSLNSTGMRQGRQVVNETRFFMTDAGIGFESFHYGRHNETVYGRRILLTTTGVHLQSGEPTNTPDDPSTYTGPYTWTDAHVFKWEQAEPDPLAPWEAFANISDILAGTITTGDIVMTGTLNGYIPTRTYVSTKTFNATSATQSFTVTPADGYELVALKMETGENLLVDSHITAVSWLGTTLTITRDSAASYANRNIVATFIKV